LNTTSLDVFDAQALGVAVPRNKELAMLNRTSMAVFALFAASVMTSVNAHPTLKSANPPAEGASVSAPTEIKLNFSEGVISKFSSAELQDRSAMKIATGMVATNPKGQKELVVPLQAPLCHG
jgi:methionine-rich copper-binding protein CopC